MSTSLYVSTPKDLTNVVPYVRNLNSLHADSLEPLLYIREELPILLVFL